MSRHNQDKHVSEDHETSPLCGAGISGDLQECMQSNEAVVCTGQLSPAVTEFGSSQEAQKAMQVRPNTIYRYEKVTDNGPSECTLCGMSFPDVLGAMRHGVLHFEEQSFSAFRKVLCGCGTYVMARFSLDHALRHVEPLGPELVCCTVCPNGTSAHKVTKWLQHWLERHSCEPLETEVRCKCGELVDLDAYLDHYVDEHLRKRVFLDSMAIAFSSQENDTQGAMGTTQVTVSEEVVTYQDLGDIIHNELPLPVPSKVGDAPTESRDHTIVNFMERPLPLGPYKWQSSHLPGDTVADLEPVGELITRAVFREKMAGFQNFTFDTVRVRLQVNAQPFQQGILMAIAIPQGRNMQQGQFSNLTNLRSMSAFPRAMINLAENQSVEMVLPWVHPQDACVTADMSLRTMYRIRLVAYTRLLPESDVNVACWAKFDGVHLSIPTGIAFAGDFRAKTKPVSKGSKTFAARKEVEVASKEGTLTQIAGAAGKVAGALSGVPILSSIAPVAQTVASGLHSIFSALGWSKPVQLSAPQVVVNKPGRYMANALGSDESRVWAVDPRASTTVDPLFGTEVDEMALTTLTSRFSYEDIFEWKESDAPNTILTQFQVHPVTLYLQNVDTFNVDGTTYTNRDASCSFLAYVAQFFGLWRGTIKYRFHISKTAAMHSGRLLVEIIPGGAQKLTNWAADETFHSYDADKVYRKVVDLAGCSSFDLEVPYTSPFPWCPIWYNFPGSSSSVPWGGASPKAIVTSVRIKVLTELRRPNSLSSDVISVTREICGGSDFELATPHGGFGLPVYQSAPAIRTALAFSDWDLAANVLGQTSDPALFQNAQRGPVVDSTIGDVVFSVKALLNRFVQLYSGIRITGNYFFINHEAIPQIAANRLNETPARSSERNDAYSWFSPLYAYVRGGWRTKILGNVNNAGKDNVILHNPVFNCSMFTGPSDFPLNGGKASATTRVASGSVKTACDLQVDGIGEFSRPYYNPLGHMHFNPYFTRLGFTLDQFECPNALEDAPTVFHAPSDDFQMGFIVGHPIVRYTDYGL